jgi:hypothetical protein
MFANDIIGTWSVVYDGYTATLDITGTDQVFVEVEPPCEYRYQAIAGSWTGGNGTFQMTGTLGGKDTNRRDGPQCPSSLHLVNFTIPFNANAPQPFQGYIFTKDPTHMAGYTWWENQPFGWYASK